MNPVNDFKITDSIHSNSISQSVNQNSNEDASKVCWVGTSFFSEDWGDDHLDSEEGTPAKPMMAQQAGAMSFWIQRKWPLKSHEDAMSLGDEFLDSEKMVRA